MKPAKLIYNLINLVVLLIAAALFLESYRDGAALFSGLGLSYLLLFAGAVLLVHGIKAFRLYLALYGSEIRISDYLKCWCKVTPVSLILPMKSGEFFRMYCFGILLKDKLKGVVLILLDRFMDTLALVTVVIAVKLVAGGSLSALVYFLLLFLALSLGLYCVFPGLYRFWKSFLLSARATERKLSMLRFMEALHSIYKEIAAVTKGRGLLLYLLSLLAWGVEIGSVTLLSGFAGGTLSSGVLGTYLSAALGTGDSADLKRFVFISIILLIAAYLLIKAAELMTGKRSKE
ncbi:MAG: flippase-like domain-containing protein [Lachnospiraceae bacterium]|nr:flippase-like domain-containing protein [Lachnospiraceae bacterium]